MVYEKPFGKKSSHSFNMHANIICHLHFALFLLIIYQGSVLLLENLRFHIEEEGKGVDSEGNKVLHSL